MFNRRLGYFISTPPPPSPPFPLPLPPPPPHLTSNLRPSFILVGIVLTVVFFVSASIHLLIRYLNSRCITTSTSDDDVAPNEPVNIHRISTRRVVPDNHQSLIDSLPLFSFTAISGLRSTASADCAVCLSKFEPDDQLRLLPLCCHAFHSTCIDAWLASNHTCPLCRSTVHVDGSDAYQKLFSTSSRAESFRVEVGNVSSGRRIASDSGHDRRRSYSIGSFEYLVHEDETVEVVVEPIQLTEPESVFGGKKEEPGTENPRPPGSDVAEEVAAGSRGSWLKDYVDRLSRSSSSLSSRALSLRFSGRFFTGSSRRSEIALGSGRRNIENDGSWDLERNEYGEEIGSFLRWLTGV